MGRADIEVSETLLEQLTKEPYLGQLTIERSTYVGDGFYWLTVTSARLPENCRGVQEAILDGDEIRFQDALDT